MTRKANDNSTYQKGGVSFFEDISVISKTQVLRIKFNGKDLALRKAVKHFVPLVNKKL